MAIKFDTSQLKAKRVDDCTIVMGAIGSGMTWKLLEACIELAQAEQGVVYVNRELGKDTILDRIERLGANREDLTELHLMAISPRTTPQITASHILDCINNTIVPIRHVCLDGHSNADTFAIIELLKGHNLSFIIGLAGR